MTTTPTTLVNIVTVKPGATRDAVLESLRHNTETVIATLQGWISTTLIATGDGRAVIYSQWERAEDIEAMRADPRMQAYFPKVAELASFDSMAGGAVFMHHR